MANRVERNGLGWMRCWSPKAAGPERPAPRCVPHNPRPVPGTPNPGGGGGVRPGTLLQDCPHPLKMCKPPGPPGRRPAGSPPAGRREAPRSAAPGDPAHKSPARGPCSSPSFSMLPGSQVELGGLKRRVNEASVQNDSFLNQAARSVLGK